MHTWVDVHDQLLKIDRDTASISSKRESNKYEKLDMARGSEELLCLMAL
jgi:NAD(P)H-nitrite reductase large subunit